MVHSKSILRIKNRSLMISQWMVFYILIVNLFFITCTSSEHKTQIIQAIDYLPTQFVPSINDPRDKVQIYSQIYETLVSISHDDGTTILPNLAKEWTISVDKKSITFILNENIMFHDGTKLNAEVAKYSIDWLIKNTKSYYLSLIESIELVDQFTFKINLIQYDSKFIYFLASPKSIIIISKLALETKGQDIYKHPVGSGPFYIETRDSNKITLVSFQKYRKYDGNIKKITFLHFPYSKKLEEGFINGDVDIVYAVNGYSIDRMRWSGKINYVVQKPMYINLLGFNLKNGFLKNSNIRDAIKYSLNLNKIFYNLNRSNAIPANSPLLSYHPIFEKYKQDKYDLIQARKLINKKNIRLPLYYPSYAFLRSTYLEIFKNELNKSGIVVNPIAFESWEAYNKAVLSDSAALFFYGWRNDILGDAGNFLYSLFHSKSPDNSFRYKNNDVDQLLDLAKTEYNRESRINLYKQVLDHILNDKPAIFLFHLKEYYAYNSKKIKSISMNPYGIINYKDVIVDENY
ncbi:MAG: ABC transporter substrate-binding protein [Promethearchaeota archaeon]